MHIWAGEPLDLEDLRGQRLTPAVLREATDRIMAAITLLLEQIRGGQAPDDRFDPKAAGLPETGNPQVRPGGTPSATRAPLDAIQPEST